jgi:uncharacterized protein (TIRG00374 family)
LGSALNVEYIEPSPLAEPIPEEFSSRRLGRSALILGAVVLAVVVVVGLLPGLGSLRESFSGARPEWLAVAVALEVLSCLSYVLIFRGVFCRHMRPVTSYEIATAELGANSLLSVGGVGGLVLGAWILRRGGMQRDQIARRTVAFFLLTSLANVGAVFIVGIGIAVGALDGPSNPAYGIVPAVVAVAAIGVALAARPLAQRLADRTQRLRVERALESLAGGIEEALALLRSRSWLVVSGAIGYMLFDVAVLGVCFTAFGMDVPPWGVVLLAYLIGQLGGLIPIPGGIGGVDGGLIGTLVLYGVRATPAAVGVLAYRAVVLWIPVVLSVPSLKSLRRRLSDEAQEIAACTPGEDVEVLVAELIARS